MNLFKKKKEMDAATIERMMAEVCAKELANKLFGKLDTQLAQEKGNDTYPKGTFFQRPDGTAYTPDGKVCDVPPVKLYTTDGIRFTDDPNGGVETTLPIEQEKQKRKYTKKNKEFWGSKKTAQAEEHKEDTLRSFRQRRAAGPAISPDDFAMLAREGDVYYIPYVGDDYGPQQSRYSGRVCNRLKTRISTIYGVNGTTHGAENLMKIECLKK